jgi:hypothetical protein
VRPSTVVVVSVLALGAGLALAEGPASGPAAAPSSLPAPADDAGRASGSPHESSTAAPPRLPQPAPQGRPADFDLAARNASCEACHADVATEWRTSLHRRAWSDPVFINAYVLEPTPFCRSCHAPEASPERSPGAAARDLGVACVTCHVIDGQTVGSRTVAATSRGHAVRGDARFATEQVCSACHQFAFPEPQAAAMQSTLDEHARSANASTSCQTCHMPLVVSGDREDERPHRSHEFHVFGNTPLLRSALRATAARSGPQAITVALTASSIGHDLPTGDMFRRLVVRASAGAERARPVTLARRFVLEHRGPATYRRQVGDDRLPGSGELRRVTVAFAEDVAEKEVRWEVVYQRMDDGMTQTFGLDQAKDEVVLAEGSLAPSSR